MLPATATSFARAIVAATGFEAREVAAADLPGDLVLVRALAPVDALDATPILRVLPPRDFGGYVFGPEAR